MSVSKKSNAQGFGGDWSIHKVLTVESYLKQYQGVFKEHPEFTLIYVDAFAGSGSFSFETGVDAPLFNEKRAASEHAGSSMRALAVQPPFDRLYFIDTKSSNLDALGKQIATNEDYKRRAQLLPGDANVHVKSICVELRSQPLTRGVIFLDPFGTQVEWSTLRAIADTRKLDVWYLFPLAGVYRNTPLEIDGLSADKKRAVSRALGTDEWMDRFYSLPSATTLSLFEDEPTTPPKKRSVNVRGIEAFVHQRLQTLFPQVLPPKTVIGQNNVPAFSLFFAVSNPDPTVLGIASRIASHLLKKRR